MHFFSEKFKCKKILETSKVAKIKQVNYVEKTLMTKKDAITNYDIFICADKNGK